MGASAPSPLVLFDFLCDIVKSFFSEIVTFQRDNLFKIWIVVDVMIAASALEQVSIFFKGFNGYLSVIHEDLLLMIILYTTLCNISRAEYTNLHNYKGEALMIILDLALTIIGLIIMFAVARHWVRHTDCYNCK